MVLLEIFTPLNIQKLYDKELKTFRRDHLDTLLENLKKSLPKNHFMNTILPRMLELEERNRPTFVELLIALPTVSEVFDYYEKIEGRTDTRVFSRVKPGTGINPLDSKLVMGSTIKLSNQWQKQIDDEGCEPPLPEEHSHKHSNQTISRKTIESGFQAFEVDFHEYVTKKNRVTAEVQNINTAGKPMQPSKHEWYEKQGDMFIYKDYIPPIHSKNRLIHGDSNRQFYEDRPNTDDYSGKVQELSPAEKAIGLIALLDNFNQADIRKQTDYNFENYLLAGKETVIDPYDNHPQTNVPVKEARQFYPHERTTTKYLRDYLDNTPEARPHFKQVNRGPSGKSLHVPLDPMTAMRIDRYSDLTGLYAMGVQEDSVDLVELHRQLATR